MLNLLPHEVLSQIYTFLGTSNTIYCRCISKQQQQFVNSLSFDHVHIPVHDDDSRYIVWSWLDALQPLCIRSLRLTTIDYSAIQYLSAFTGLEVLKIDHFVWRQFTSEPWALFGGDLELELMCWKMKSLRSFSINEHSDARLNHEDRRCLLFHTRAFVETTPSLRHLSLANVNCRDYNVVQGIRKSNITRLCLRNTLALNWLSDLRGNHTLKRLEFRTVDIVEDTDIVNVLRTLSLDTHLVEVRFGWHSGFDTNVAGRVSRFLAKSQTLKSLTIVESGHSSEEVRIVWGKALERANFNYFVEDDNDFGWECNYRRMFI